MLGTVSALDFSGKIMLAPMVRIGRLPMRVMALKYGADLVYSPEIIDRRLIASKRIVNEKLGTIDYVDDSGTLNLRIHPKEKGKLIVQMGTADPERAVAAASVVAQDVAGIDVNCGCPKKFSVVSAMGSALLEDPDRLESILRALSSQIKVPISCKIRMIPKSEDGDFIQNTVKFVKRIQDTGIKALGVHCRFTFEKPREPGHWEIFEHLSKVMTIPLIANGDFYSLEDIAKLQAQVPAVSSFLIARGAQWNPSVFRKEGPLPGKDMVMEYLDIATKYDMHPKNTKYVLIQFQIDGKGAVDFKKHLNSTKSHDEMRDLAQKYLFETEAPAAKRPRLESVM